MVGESGGRRRAPVTSLVEFRAKLQSPMSQSLEVVGGGLGDDVRPLRNSSSADIESACNVDRLLEMGDDVTLEHAPMLTIVNPVMQPCSAQPSLTLVSMEPWDKELLSDRLKWAIENGQVSQSDLAKRCGVSTAAVSKWVGGDTSNLKMENLFAAAELCKVSARWLGTNQGTPLDGINAAFAGISGNDLQIAKRLSEVDDRSLRSTVTELISAKEATKTATKRRKRSKP